MPPNLLANLLTPTYDPILACMGTYHSAEFACYAAATETHVLWAINLCVSYTGTLTVQVIAHSLKKIWWYFNIAEVYYLLYCIRNYLNYQYKYWDM